MRYQICVSGAAAGETVDDSHSQAFALGVEIARAGKTLLTGATVGLPHYAAMGFKSIKNPRGSSIGFSPASSFREHVSTYRLLRLNLTTLTLPAWNMWGVTCTWYVVVMQSLQLGVGWVVCTKWRPHLRVVRYVAYCLEAVVWLIMLRRY